jgi:hypothetical protein
MLHLQRSANFNLDETDSQCRDATLALRRQVLERQRDLAAMHTLAPRLKSGTGWSIA